ncbi:MAG: hypothetical protein R3C04_00480 [Hyphomonas sp.]
MSPHFRAFRPLWLTAGRSSTTSWKPEGQYVFFSGSELLKRSLRFLYGRFRVQPKFLEGLSASVDYVNFEIEDAITSLNFPALHVCVWKVATSPVTRPVRTSSVIGRSKILYGFAVRSTLLCSRLDGIDVQVSYANDVPTFGNANALRFVLCTYRTASTNSTVPVQCRPAPSSFMGSVGYRTTRST